MSQPQKLKPNKEDLGELHPMEIDLILTLRHKYRFGKVEIDMRDGIPQNLLKTIERTNLGNFDVIHTQDLRESYPRLYTDER